MQSKSRSLEKPKQINVRLHFKDKVDGEIEDAIFQEVFRILGVFDNPIVSKEMKTIIT